MRLRPGASTEHLARPHAWEGHLRGTFPPPARALLKWRGHGRRLGAGTSHGRTAVPPRSPFSALLHRGGGHAVEIYRGARTGAGSGWEQGR